MAQNSRSRLSPLTENPKAWSVADDDGQRQSVHARIWVGLESRSAMNPNLAKPATTMMTPTKIDSSSDARATAADLSFPANSNGTVVARDHRIRERSRGREHEHSGCSEDRVADQAEDGRVQAGDRRRPASSPHAIPQAAGRRTARGRRRCPWPAISAGTR